MPRVTESLQARIPANKFSPPLLDERDSLVRERLLAYLREEGEGKRLLSVTGQAGQGKSVLAAQFAARAAGRVAWYQLGAEDRDPVLSVIALLVCLKEALPGFASPMLETMIEKGELSPAELRAAVNLLLGDLGRYRGGSLLLILEDLHLVEGFPQTLELLDYLIATAPPSSIAVLATSRLPGLLDLSALRAARQVLEITNEQLAFTGEELGALYHDVFQSPLAGRRAEWMQRVTGGWAMGLVLLREAVADELDEDTYLDSSGVGGRARIFDYFRREVLSTLPPARRVLLVRLAHLREVPAPLLERLGEGPEVLAWMDGLSRRYLFVRGHEGAPAVYRLHHLFQEFLREEGRTLIDGEALRTLYRVAADYYLDAGEVAEALEYRLSAGDYAAAEPLLKREALVLLGSGRKRTLAILLERIPEMRIAADPWLSFHLAAVRMELDPLAALDPLRWARRGFARRGDLRGELLALAELTRFHIFLDGRLKRAARYLARGRGLLPRLEPGTEPVSQVLIHLGLGNGALFVDFDQEEAARYFSTALRVADEYDFVGLAAEARVGLGFCAVFEPGGVKCLQYIEQAHRSCLNPRVGTLNRLMVLLLKTNALEMWGDFFHYRHHADRLERFGEEGFVTKTVAGPFAVIWRVDEALAEGRLDEASARVEEGLGFGSAVANPHIRGQFLYYRALCRVLSGDADGAVAAATEAMALRRRAGGRFFIALACTLNGVALALAGRPAEAESLLNEAVARCRRTGMEWLGVGAHLYRAYLLDSLERDEEAAQDIRQGLQLLREGAFVYLYGWLPRVLERLLCRAVERGIEVDYARRLAAERLAIAITDDGTPLPRLRFESLGGFVVKAGARQCDESVFGSGQRALLALLLSRPGLRLEQESVRAELWPDASPPKARMRLDTLLSRLRKLLGERLSLAHPERYLTLERGVVALHDCQVDAAGFEQAANQGLWHAGKGNAWQAGNAFRAAFSRWRGRFLPGAGGGESVEHYRKGLETLHLRAALAWASILESEGEGEEAAERLTAAHRLAPTDDEVVRRLHALHRRLRRPAAAVRLLKGYREALLRDDYPESEVEEILREVVRG